MAKREPVAWYSTKTGKHIPIFEGETKEDAIKRLKESVDKVQKQRNAQKIAKAQKIADAKEQHEKAKSEFKEAVSKARKDASEKNMSDAKAKSEAVKKTRQNLEQSKKHDNKAPVVPEGTKIKLKRNNPEDSEKKTNSSVDETKKSVQQTEHKQDSHKNPAESSKVSTQEKRQKQMDDAKAKADKLNAEKKYEESVKMGNKVGTKDGHLTFKGKDVKPLDTADAVKGIKEDGQGSLKDYMDENGNLSKERLETHQKIIEEYFGDHKPYKPGEEKKALFTGGGGASGKGSLFTDKENWKYSSYDNPIIVDADELKKRLNTYDYDHGRHDNKDLTDVTTGWYHEESSALAKQIYQMALDNDFPVMYDGTACGKGIYKLLDQAKEKGYKTEMNFLFSNWQTVIGNSLTRYLKTGRLVPLVQQLNAHSKAFEAVNNLYNKVDNFTLWDNRAEGKGYYKDRKTGKKKFGNLYNAQKVATSSNGGPLDITNKRAWNFFKDSANEFQWTQEKDDKFVTMAKAVADQKGYKVASSLAWLKEHKPDLLNNRKNNNNNNRRR